MVQIEGSELEVRVRDPQHAHHHLLVTRGEGLQWQWSAASSLCCSRESRLTCNRQPESRGFCALIAQCLYASSK